MANNVTLASGALVVATQGDANNVQTQKVITDFLSSAGLPIDVATTTPLIVTDQAQIDLLTAILIELRVLSELTYSMCKTESEHIEDYRTKYKDFPVTVT